MIIAMQSTSIRKYHDKKKTVTDQIIQGNATYYPYWTLIIYISIFNIPRSPKVNRAINKHTLARD